MRVLQRLDQLDMHVALSQMHQRQLADRAVRLDKQHAPARLPARAGEVILVELQRRQIQDEARSLAGVALAGDPAVVTGSDLLDNGQAQARSRAGRVVKSDSKICGITSGAIPVPESRIVTRMKAPWREEPAGRSSPHESSRAGSFSWPASSTRRVSKVSRPPWGMASRALPARFNRARASSTDSPSTQAPPGAKRNSTAV